jgi:hypothetical protein
MVVPSPEGRTTVSFTRNDGYALCAIAFAVSKETP